MNRIMIPVAGLAAVALVAGGIRAVDDRGPDRTQTAIGQDPDRERRSRDWGEAALRDIESAVASVASPDAPLRERIIAANLVVSRMRNGPPAGTNANWPDYLALGLANGSCGRRAELLATLIERMAPGTPTRHAGMASVPQQVGHTTLEVQLVPGTWSWFDPSPGLFFTEDGTLEGRILSQQEVFADPSIVDRIGPFAPIDDRQDVAPRAVAFAGTLTSLIQREPGFTRSNFPLREMLETASSWGTEDPLDPRPGRMHLHAIERPELIAATLDEEGRIVRAAVRSTDGRRLAWHGRAGVSSRGINVVPVVEIDGLTPGRTYEFAVRWVERDPDVLLSPLVATGGRIAQWQRTREPGPDREDIFEIAATNVADADACVVVLLHAADEYNERAEILSYRVSESTASFVSAPTAGPTP